MLGTPLPPALASALETVALRHDYGAKAVLQGLDLRVPRGEVYALLGGNGAGKSTTIGILLGLIKPTGGQARVCGLDPWTDAARARALLAYVPERVALYEHLTALENLAYFLALARAQSDRDAVLAPALEAVGLPREAWTRRVGGFSKGMRQKVAIAIALARQVPVLLLDEPTSGLDPYASSEFNRLLQGLKAQQVTTLMVTHDLLSAVDVADRIGFLAHGRLVTELAAAGPQRFDLRDLHRRYLGQGVPA